MYPRSSPRPPKKNSTENASGTMTQPQSSMANEPPMVASNNRLAQTQQKVNEVVDIMRENVDKMMVRGEQLEELDRTTVSLAESAKGFQMTTKKLKKKYWWQNTKVVLIMVCVAVLVIVVIIVAIFGIPSGDNAIANEGEGGATAPVPPVQQVNNDSVSSGSRQFGFT